jgi:hypothetical protein
MKVDSIKQQWDRALALVAAAVGVTALLLGWVGVSGASLVTQQIPYLVSGAVVGLLAFGVASTLWISADLRDEWAKLDDIYRAISDQPLGDGHARADTVVLDGPPPEQLALDETGRAGPDAVELRRERARSGGRR